MSDKGLPSKLHKTLNRLSSEQVAYKNAMSRNFFKEDIHMTKRYVRITREMQIKMTWEHPLTDRSALSESKEHAYASTWRKGCLVYCWVNVCWHSHHRKQCRGSSKNEKEGPGAVT